VMDLCFVHRNPKKRIGFASQASYL
jgi:hypothetical protein